jgi:hypothetical protein
MNSFDFDSQTPNREQMLQFAIRAAKENNPDSALMMFRQVLESDPDNERAMMWMAKLSKTAAERQQWLKRVVDLNPENEAARAALKKLNYRTASRDNRVLIIFGVVAVMLMIIGVVLLVAVLSSPR